MQQHASNRDAVGQYEGVGPGHAKICLSHADVSRVGLRQELPLGLYIIPSLPFASNSIVA